MEATEQFLQWVEESGNIVFFGGAGVSTESGIPDFRSVDGLYNQQYKYPPVNRGRLVVTYMALDALKSFAV